MDNLGQELLVAVSRTNFEIAERNKNLMRILNSLGSSLPPSHRPEAEVQDQQSALFRRSTNSMTCTGDEMTKGQTVSSIDPAAVNKNFAHKLFDLLESGSQVDIIRWIPNGRAFIIVDKHRFTNETLPLYFKAPRQYNSFTRKLNRWKFKRVSRGPWTGAYYHKDFWSGNRQQCNLISCTKRNKRSTSKTVVNSKSTPPSAISSSASTTEKDLLAPFLPRSTSCFDKFGGLIEEAISSSSSSREHDEMNFTSNRILRMKQKMIETDLEIAKVKALKKILKMKIETNRLKAIQADFANTLASRSPGNEQISKVSSILSHTLPRPGGAKALLYARNVLNRSPHEQACYLLPRQEEEDFPICKY